MSDPANHPEFLRTIAENLDDDVPRLVYADFLDDHGFADRAEMIRVQCRLASLEIQEPERFDLELREEELQKLLPTWNQSWGELATEIGWRRGFPNQFTVDAARFAEVVPRLLRETPGRHFRIETFDPEIELTHGLSRDEVVARARSWDVVDLDRRGDRFFLTEGLAHVRSMDVNCYQLHFQSEQQFFRLLDAQFTRLRGLRIRQFINSALEGEFTHRLHHLALEQIACEPLPAWVRLFRSKGFSELRRLSFERCDIDNDLVRDLIRSPFFQGLKSWSLQKSEISSTGIAELLSVDLPILRELDLSSQNGLGESLLGQVLDRPELCELRDLRLNSCYLDEEFGQLLGRNQNLKNLQRLELDLCKMGTLGCVGLANAPWGPKLVILDLTANALSDVGVMELCRSRSLTSLRELRLGRNQIGGAGLRALMKSRIIQGVCRLDLSDNLLTNKDMSDIIASDEKPELRHLNLSGNLIEDSGAVSLSRMDNLPRLRLLDIRGNRIGDRGRKVLRETFGDRVRI